jgi:hypothetical protein
MRILIYLALVLLLAFTFGCKKAAQTASETIAEKAIEQGSGGKVDVDLKNGGATITDKETGNTTTVDAKGGKMPEGWPKNIPQYPGSKVTQSSATDTEKGKSFSIILETQDAVDKVNEYYAKELKGAGFKKSTEMTRDDGVTVFYQSEKEVLTMTIFTDKSKTILSISLTPNS